MSRLLEFLEEWAWLIVGGLLMAAFWGTILHDLFTFY